MQSVSSPAESSARNMGRTISIRGISKRFDQTQANDEISFDIRGGTIHSVIGQNGAGKSTLMKIIFGLERADSGEIVLDGNRLAIDSPRDALAAGIGLVRNVCRLHLEHHREADPRGDDGSRLRARGEFLGRGRDAVAREERLRVWARQGSPAIPELGIRLF